MRLENKESSLPEICIKFTRERIDWNHLAWWNLLQNLRFCGMWAMSEIPPVNVTVSGETGRSQKREIVGWAAAIHDEQREGIKLSACPRAFVNTPGWERHSWLTKICALLVCVSHNTEAPWRLLSCFPSDPLWGLVARHPIWHCALWSVDPDYVQMTVVNTFSVHVGIAGAALDSWFCVCCPNNPKIFRSPKSCGFIWVHPSFDLWCYLGMAHPSTLQKQYGQYLQKHLWWCPCHVNNPKDLLN